MNDTDWVLLMDATEKLDAAAESGQDCISTLCTLSEAGEWMAANDGREVYYAPCDDGERKSAVERGVAPVETYAPGDGLIPTRVARRFGCDEVNVCKNAGYFLQGDDIIDRPVFQIQQDESGNSVLRKTTLHDILLNDGNDGEDVDWKPLKWSHLQTVVDSSGGQSERYKLLVAILRRFLDAEVSAATFVPYGEMFADSDFL